MNDEKTDPMATLDTEPAPELCQSSDKTAPEGKCQLPAVTRVFWPGSEPLKFCEAHATTAKRVADAMGLYLHREPL